MGTISVKHHTSQTLFLFGLTIAIFVRAALGLRVRLGRAQLLFACGVSAPIQCS